MNDAHGGATAAMDQRFQALVDAAIAADDLVVPACPSAFLAIQRLIATEDFSLADLTKIVEPDSALSAAALRYANSALYAGKEPATTTKAAIARLGTRELVSVALAVALGGEARRDGPLASVRRLVFQEALIGAILCRDLAPHFDVNADEAYVCGLLHDFGRLVGVSVLEKLPAGEITTPLTDRQWLGVLDARHTALGGELARRWGLPAVVADVIVDHHGEANTGMRRVVAFADRLVAELALKPAIADCEIVKVGAVTDDKFLRAVHDAMVRLPQSMAELLEELRNARATPAPKTWVSEASALGPDASSVDVPVTIVRGRADVPARIVAVAPKVFRVQSKVALDQGYMVKLTFAFAGTSHTLFGTVVVCQPADGGFAADLAPFGLSDAQRTVWFEFWKSGTAK